MSEDPADFDICDEHEVSFLRHTFCPWCRITELEAELAGAHLAEEAATAKQAEAWAYTAELQAKVAQGIRVIEHNKNQIDELQADGVAIMRRNELLEAKLETVNQTLSLSLKNESDLEDKVADLEAEIKEWESGALVRGWRETR